MILVISCPEIGTLVPLTASTTHADPKNPKKGFLITSRRFHKGSCAQIGAMATLMRRICMLRHISRHPKKVSTTQLRAEFAAAPSLPNLYRP
jgi:hypothetical protein